MVAQDIPKTKVDYPVELSGTCLIRDAINSKNGDSVVDIDCSTVVEVDANGGTGDIGKIYKVKEVIGCTTIT